jgi:hypothetical protein
LQPISSGIRIARTSHRHPMPRLSLIGCPKGSTRRAGVPPALLARVGAWNGPVQDGGTRYARSPLHCLGCSFPARPLCRAGWQSMRPKRPDAPRLPRPMP